MCRNYAPLGPESTPWVDSVDVPSVTATASPPELTPRRRELLEAAVHVVADEGLRGLTHRAVDRRAGLPEGTCSAYLRTRQALQVAVTQYVAAALTADVDRLAAELSELPGTARGRRSGPRSSSARWCCSSAGSTSGSGADPARAVHGGAPQPGCRGGARSSAGPGWSTSSTRSWSPATASTARTGRRRLSPPSTGCSSPPSRSRGGAPTVPQRVAHAGPARADGAR